jgi:hypothetical protein
MTDVDVFLPSTDKMLVFPMSKAISLDYGQMDYPTRVAVSLGGLQYLDGDSTHFIIVQSGEAEVSHDGNVYWLRAGQFGWRDQI